MSEQNIRGTEPGRNLPGDDVEGHMPRVSFVDPEKTEDDTDGHGNRLPGAGMPDDDVEGHGTRSFGNIEGTDAN